jgi:hypothetical protein
MGTGYLDGSTPICMPSIFSAMLGNCVAGSFDGDKVRVKLQAGRKLSH